MPKDDFKPDREQIVEEAIPAAILVKEEILHVRTATIKTLANIAGRQRARLDVSREMETLQGNIMALYMLLREKFGPTNKVRQLDGIMISYSRKTGIVRDPDFKTLYGYFCALNHKIEELKITKIERRKVDESEALA